MDYVCPIRNPSDSASVNLRENEQSFFTSKFATFRRYNLDLGFAVCDVLARKSSRTSRWYCIIYMVKIRMGLALNPGFLLD